jgi:transketolase
MFRSSLLAESALKAVKTLNYDAGSKETAAMGKDQTEFSIDTIFRPDASFHEDPAGRNVFFGVREFAMCAAVNGMAAHGGLVSFGSTFSCFADYCKPAIRLAALMGAHSLFVFTHDSLGLGQDGRTHQQPKKEAPPPREPKRTRQH